MDNLPPIGPSEAPGKKPTWYRKQLEILASNPEAMQAFRDKQRAYRRSYRARQRAERRLAKSRRGLVRVEKGEASPGVWSWRKNHEKTISLKYQPHSHQAKFRDLIAEGRRFVFLIGGRQCGKSHALCYEVLRQIYKYRREPAVGWILSPTYPMSEVLQAKFEEIAGFAENGGLILKKYKSPNVYYLLKPPRGSKLPFRLDIKTGEHPDRLRGATLAFAALDEASYMLESVFKILLPTVAISRGPIIGATTPKGKDWVYRNIIQKAEANDPLYGVVRAKTMDNAHLTETDVATIRAAYSADLAKQELEGEIIAFSGLVYPNFGPDRLIKPVVAIPDDAELIGGLDFGWKDPFVHLWIMKRGGKYYVVDEYYDNQRTIEEHARAIRERPFNGKVLRRWADPSAAQAAADLERFGVGSYPANNDLKLGIDCVKRLLEQRRLFVAENCANLIAEFGQYHYPERIGRNTDDIPVDYANHTLDALRYALFQEESYSTCHPVVVHADDGRVFVEGSAPLPRSHVWADLPFHEIQEWPVDED